MSKYDNWKTMDEISDSDEHHKYLKTGYHTIDKNIQGLILGGTSIISGTNGSAKSTAIGQIALNVINSGQSQVGIFSGELTDTRFKRWLYLQAAGKSRNKAKIDERGRAIDFYTTPQIIKDRITEWIVDKLYLYDNTKGFTIAAVGQSIQNLLDKNREVKLIFIDNLFVLDINSLSEQKWEAQKQLILKMCQLAKKFGVHIAFVCHPTKIKTLIRKEDISGSSDLTNAVDNVFIFHRNTTDFKKKAKEYFGWGDSHELFAYDNIMEIAKDRESGAVEVLNGFYFEKESKRLLNKRDESVVYGWDKEPVQSTYINNQALYEGGTLKADLDIEDLFP